VVEAGLLRVMSFNIRGFSRRGDGINSWENRAALNVATIKRYAPDLIGLQELRAEGLATYREKLPEYAHILGPGAGNKTPHGISKTTAWWCARRSTLLEAGRRK
jgi:exonuclease III